MLVKLRYVTKHTDRRGGARWYWQRRGHKLTRLPDNPIERMAIVRFMVLANGLSRQASRITRRSRLAGSIATRTRSSDSASSYTSVSRSSLASTGIK